MRIIVLKNGEEVFVDAEDYEYLNQWSWHLSRSGYAVRGEYNNGDYRTIRMHRLLAGDPIGKKVDHQNLNKFDNQRSNLRVATVSQNGMNREKQSNNSSGYKGVYFEKYTGRWKAQIGVNGRNINLGRFNTAKEAALAYNVAAIKYHGDFARVNEI